MGIVLSGPKPSQRDLAPEEKISHGIDNAVFIGASWENKGQVWKNDGGFLTCPGVASLGPICVSEDSNVADTIRKHTAPGAILHKMVLNPGQYYSRIARPSNQHPLDVPTSPNFAPRDQQEIHSSARHFLSLVKKTRRDLRRHRAYRK